MPILMAPPRPIPDEAIPGHPATLNGLNAAVTGGVYRAPQITLVAGLTLKLTDDLILVADQRLQIDGSIGLAANVMQPVNVVLVSLEESVRISVTGRVGAPGQFAANGLDAILNAANAAAQSQPGVNGGYVKILAPLGSIVIDGEVNATAGGDGGVAQASGAGGFFGGVGGNGTASGGQGGGGGDVLLAALEDIVVRMVGGILRGGAGGAGGFANATARSSGFARADGGPGNVGGRITFVGLAPDLTTAVEAGWIIAGAGGRGGLAQARVVSAAFRARGGSATASGGKGAPGGTVVFRNCVASLSGQPESGNGGNGGAGVAQGGDGASRLPKGAPGGPAEARGGYAGGAGAIPQFRVPSGGIGQGRVMQGGPGTWCTGGAATAVGGTGGDPFLWGNGGDSGSATATGGTGCSGIAAAAVATGPVLAGAAFGSPGAICPPAVSPGTS